MTDDSYVFDTYALIEILKGNNSYKLYTNAQIVVNKWIIAELSYWLLREYNKQTMHKFVSVYAQFIQDVDIDTIGKAMQFRLLHKSKKLSMVDCISYLQAQQLNVPFLTGDKQFHNVKGVAFVT